MKVSLNSSIIEELKPLLAIDELHPILYRIEVEENELSVPDEIILIIKNAHRFMTIIMEAKAYSFEDRNYQTVQGF